MVLIRTLQGVLALTAALGVSQPAPAAVITTATGVQDTDTGLSWLKLNATAGLSFNTLAPQLAPGGAFADYRLATRSEAETLVTNRFSGITNTTLVRTAFFDFVTAMGGNPLRDMGGMGTTLEMGGITAEAGPHVTLTPISGSGASAGTPAFSSGTHRPYIFAGVNVAGPLGPDAYIEQGNLYGLTAVPDSFTTPFAITPLSLAGFQSLQASQGFRTSQNLVEFPPVAAGFWLVQSTTTTPVPEPGSVALLCAGLAGLAVIRRKPG